MFTVTTKTKMKESLEDNQASNLERQRYLETRIEDAISNCELATSPEARKAIESYYEDHYLLATTLETVINGGKIEDKDNTSADTPYVLRQRLTELTEANSEYLENPDSTMAKTRIVSAAVKTVNDLFTESGLGIITLSDDEISQRVHLVNETAAFAKSLGFSMESYSGSKLDDSQYDIVISPHSSRQSPRKYVSILPAKSTIKEANEEFWGDVRHAGQIEYHSSAHIGQIMMSGGIMSRNEQQRQGMDYMIGSSSIEVRTGHHHSNVPHFSEVMGEIPEYVHGSLGGTEFPLQSGTIGIPLADIMKVAPYARDAEFGVIDIELGRHDSNHAIAPPITTNGSINAGSPDYIGSATGSDRVFFSSCEDAPQSSPDSYVVPIIGEAGRDRVIFTYEDAPSNEVPLPLGEQFPDVIHIKASDSLSAKRKEIQNDFVHRDKYKNRLVVPLRRGVFEFVPENAPHRMYENRTPARYTLKDIGSIAITAT